MNQKAPMEAWLNLKGKDLERELARLRGVKTFTSHPKWLAGKSKATKVDDDSGGKKNNTTVLLLLLGGVAIAYVMFGME
jgi:hypothetical protein